MTSSSQLVDSTTSLILNTSNHILPSFVQSMAAYNADVPEFPLPVAPIPGKKNVLVTSALPYVNNVPHLGLFFLYDYG